jgi:CRP-like cAMP-binding protein
METVVDNLDIPNERLAWLQAAEDLKKPVYLRTELETSRILTLLSRLRFFQSLSFHQRFSLTKIARFKKVPPGVMLLETHGRPSSAPSSKLEVLEFSALSVSSAEPRTAASGVETTRGKSSDPLVNFAADLHSQQRPAQEILVVVCGAVMLRVPQPQGISQTIIEKGEPIGTNIVTAALPAGSQYVTTEVTELLCLSSESIEDYLEKLEELELEQRKSFFQNLTVPILAAWSEEQFLRLARGVYPIRVLSRELVVREGTEASAAYFIFSGKLKVVREIDFSHTNGGAPSVKLLELATLSEGEFFGELALLRHRVESTKKVKLSRLTNEINFSAKKTSTEAPAMPPQHFGGSRQVSVRLAKSTKQPAASPSGASSSDSDEEDFKTLSSHKPPLLRQATVYAHTPTTLYVLPREEFMKIMTGSALVRLREYAKGYPSHEEIRSHFSKQQKWEDFKNQLVAQVRASARAPKRGS